MSTAISTIRDGDVVRITLTRADRRNAFDGAMIDELTAAFAAVGDARAVLLQGDGPSFSAGADLDWMRASVDLSPEQNRVEGQRLGALVGDAATPPIPGIDGQGVRACWTLADARAIMAQAKPGSRVLQMGAGFIGCIIMEALAARGVKLDVVEMGDRMVPRMMGPVAGGMIKDWCQRKGVTVHTGARVEEIERHGQGGMKVRLSTGRKLEADLVISATGVKPNIGFLEGSGVLRQRILVVGLDTVAEHDRVRYLHHGCLQVE